MTKNSLLAALWVKSRLGLDGELVENGLSTTVGVFKCALSQNNSLLISGPGLSDEISKDRITNLNTLIEYLIVHGDSIVILPRSIREARISSLAVEYEVDPKFVKTAISDAHRIMDQ